jgi:hypothetical protein
MRCGLNRWKHRRSLARPPPPATCASDNRELATGRYFFDDVIAVISDVEISRVVGDDRGWAGDL